jgi:hypothetical protein
MKKVLVAVLFLAAAFAVATPAAALVCPAPGSTLTLTPAQAIDVAANGFNCPAVHLKINVDIAPIVPATLKIEAATIEITGAKIITNVPNGNLFLQAANGGFIITNAEIRAANIIIIECKGVNCPITITNSIVKAPINPLESGGDVRAIAVGPVSITGSTFFGGNKVGVFSQSSTVTWICQAGVGGCLDPVTSGTALALCGPDPADATKPKVPCTITFPNLAAITAFCIDPQDVECGGGSSECQINAALDVHLENSTIKCDSHFSITSKNGSIFANGATLTAVDPLILQALNGIFAVDANLAGQFVVLEVKGGIVGPNVCIDVTNADITKPRTFQTAAGCVLVSTGLTPP